MERPSFCVTELYNKKYKNPYVVNLYAIVFASMELGEVVLLNLFDTGAMLMGFFMAIPLLPMLVALVSFETFS